MDLSYPLHTCVRKLHNYREKVSRDKGEQNAHARAKVHYNINNRCPIVMSINHVVERQTAGKMLEQLNHVKSKKKYYKVLGSEGGVHRVQSFGTPDTVTLTDTDYHCTCTLHNNRLLPCYHLYFLVMEKNMTLHLAWISNCFHCSVKTTLPFKNVPEAYDLNFLQSTQKKSSPPSQLAARKGSSTRPPSSTDSIQPGSTTGGQSL